MKKYRYFTYIFLFILFSTQGQSQNFLSTNGKAIVNEQGDTIILRGMGLGGWMLQEGYMLQTSGFADAQFQLKQKIEELIGPDDTQLFYDKWLENYVQEVDIDSLKSWGFNSVRLPMHYNLYTLPIEEEPVSGENTWLEKGFILTDSIISWCSKNQMYVVLDLHGAPGGQGYESSISDYDPSKPSLWQSEENKSKTVALWKRLAERYADEQWVAGYDLINETNWNMDQNQPLRELYGIITDSIRAVDSKHMLIIEGGSFANDFTGLTPPWDDNFVYSPHKYWSRTDQEGIQWALDIRDQNNVPVYFSESGENSNTWFRDMISQFEQNGLGWAWWPYKKVESISGPLSINKSIGYDSLLNYWNNGGDVPSHNFAKSALMQLAEDLKLERCRYQKDVIDAMFRQVNSTEAIPFNSHAIPGIVYASDFDLGPVGSAYHDGDVANYHLTTGSFTAWNQGWIYRNDGVDIQQSEDTLYTNGYNIGWTAVGEWMQYEVKVDETAVYDIEMRVASEQSGGSVHFRVGNADLTDIIPLPTTGGYQVWETVTIPNVVLTSEDKKIRLYIDEGGANISSFNFIKRGESSTINTDFVSAVTFDVETIELNLNKPMSDLLPSGSGGFEVFADGNNLTVKSVKLSGENNRKLLIEVDYQFTSQDQIKISFSGDQIFGEDSSPLSSFTQEDVRNTIIFYHPIPGRIEAEDFYYQSGIQLETTTDEGGGQNIGFLDAGDYLDYYVTISTSGSYRAKYRTAALSATGGIELQLIDEFGNPTKIHSIVFQPTGDWQTWRSTSAEVGLTAGTHQFRLLITKSQFNINWFEFSLLTSLKGLELGPVIKIFPNPSPGVFSIEADLKESIDISIEVYNINAHRIFSKSVKRISDVKEILDLSVYPDGLYYFVLKTVEGVLYSSKIVKSGN